VNPPVLTDGVPQAKDLITGPIRINKNKLIKIKYKNKFVKLNYLTVNVVNCCKGFIFDSYFSTTYQKLVKTANIIFQKGFYTRK
jgi:hypothetical protein